MGIFNRKKKVEETTQNTSKFEERANLVMTDNSFPSLSALYSNELDVLDNSAVWGAVKYLSSMVSTMPLHVFKKEGGSRIIDSNHPVSKVLNAPNPYMTKSVFLETMEINYELFGVSYAEILWSKGTLKKYPIMIVPISPRDIEVIVVDNQMNYLHLPSGKYIPREDLLIVMGSSMNGFLPMNPLKYMKSSVDLAKAGEKLQKRYFEKGTLLGGVITVPKDFTNDEKLRIKTSFDSAFTGSGNSFGTIVLNDGVVYNPIKFNAEDNQLLESRNFTIQEVARRFGVSPYALGDLSHATFSNVEQQALNDVKNTFRPRIVKFEEALNHILFNGKDKDTHYIKFSMEGLLRGDTATRYNAYHVALTDGFMNVDEVRALEDLNPIPDGTGEVFFVPMNYMNRKSAVDYVPQEYQSNPYGEAEVKPVETEIVEEIKPVEEIDALTEREQLVEASEKIIERLVRKMIRAERVAIKEQLETFSTTGLDTFKKNISTTINKISKEFTPEALEIYKSISNKLIPQIQKQVDNKDFTNQAEMDEFITKYVDGFIHRFSGKLVGDVYTISNKTTEDTAVEDFKDMGTNWGLNLAHEIKNEEKVRYTNSIVKTAFLYLGVTKMISVANAGACPICQKLDGKIVSIEGSFIDKNDEIDDGEGNVTNFKKSYAHPPYHRGCSCTIMPVLD